MNSYKIIEIKRSDAGNKIYQPNFEFRMTDAISPSMIATKQLINLDISRTLALLSADEVLLYYKKITQLCANDYTQGDLDARSDVIRVTMTHNLMRINIDIGEPQFIKQLSFMYLRKDGTIGGCNVGLDPVTNKIFAAVVKYPEDAKSYNDGIVKFFFNNELAGHILNETAQKKAIHVHSDSAMLQEFKTTMDHDAIAALVECILSNKILFKQIVNTEILRQHVANTMTDATQFNDLSVAIAKRIILKELYKIEKSKGLFDYMRAKVGIVIAAITTLILGIGPLIALFFHSRYKKDLEIKIREVTRQIQDLNTNKPQPKTDIPVIDHGLSGTANIRMFMPKQSYNSDQQSKIDLQNDHSLIL